MGIYQNYIFDLYGTLVDIHTEEDNPLVWEKLALFLGDQGARYAPQELEDAYQRLVRLLQRRADDKAGSGSSAAGFVSGTAGSIVSGMTRGTARGTAKGTARATARGREEEGGSDSHESHPEIRIEKVFEKLYTEKGIQPDFRLVLCTGRLFRTLTTEYIRLYEGVEEMLEMLRRKKKGVYLLSNAQKIFTEYELQMLGIARYFDGIMISSEQGVKKPDIRFFQSLLETYALNPRDCIMIGNDALCDIEGAKRAGMHTYYIHSNISPQGERDVEADYVQPEMDIGRVRRTLGI